MGNLVLTRRNDERIIIAHKGEILEITFKELMYNSCKVIINGSLEFKILRGEVFERENGFKKQEEKENV